MGTVGVIAIGEMGACLASALSQGGSRVVTSLAGRGEATRRRAAAAGAEDLPLAEVLATADVLVSVLPPARALALAREVAGGLGTVDRRRPGVRATRRTSLIYLDANAVAPATAVAVGELVEKAGARFVDGGIIGVPPDPLLYVSGAAAADAIDLLSGLRLTDLGPEPGRASALKMCYAAFTKGTTALATELLVAAARLGVAAELEAELRSSAPALWAIAERSVPGMRGKAYRWVGEMEEIAATFAAVGLTPKVLEGAAEIYRLVEDRGGERLPTELGRLVQEVARPSP
ncbi:MAG TPA: DUF1932 domain-containing protein [Candidatus Dormibacteraeota bacterium]